MMTLAHDNHPKAAALAAASILILLGSESKDCTLFSNTLLLIWAEKPHFDLSRGAQNHLCILMDLFH